MTSTNFHVLAKPIGPICNLSCKYCFYSEKETLYPNTVQWAMPPDILESFVRQYIASQDSSEIEFAWQGGEPTVLGLDYFRSLVALEQKYADGKQITNTFQTNGMLIDDAWAEFLCEHKFLVGVSIDGPAELHDAYRVDKGGQPTCNRVLAGIKALKKAGADFNLLATVNRLNSEHPIEVYRFLKEHGSGYMQFIPVVERASHLPAADGLSLVAPDFDGASHVTSWSVEPLKYGSFLCAIFDEWVRRDVGRQFVQLFEIALQAWTGMEPSLCAFRKTCGSALALEHNGDLYSCDHYVYPEHKLGNILDTPLSAIASSDQQVAFGESKRATLPKYCLQCDVKFACNGECPKHRFLETPDGEPGLNYLCKAYKMFFHHVDPYMRFMAGELAAGMSPASVMYWAAAEDAHKRQHAVGRNDACPCGSGLKFKRCCGKN